MMVNCDSKPAVEDGRNNQQGGRGGEGEENGEFFCGYLHFSKPNLTLVVLYTLGKAVEIRRWKGGDAFR